MKSYEDEKTATIKFKTITLPAIAAALGGTLLETGSEWCGHIDLGNEQSLFLGFDSHKNRITINGDYPKSRLSDKTEFTPRNYVYPTPEIPSIGIDANKAPAVIAADIRRRLLPTYQELFAKCAVKRDEHEAYVNGVNGFAAQLAVVLGTQVQPSRPHSNDPLRNGVRMPGGLGYTSAEVRRDEVRFTVEVSYAQALKLAEFLKTL